jgi:two-component system probable response regulator PhcQ
MTRRILMLDDEIGVLSALQRTLRRCFADRPLHIETFTDPELALLRCSEADFDVVLCDYCMPAFNGLEFLQMLKRIQPCAVRVVLSASTEFDVVMRAVNVAEVFRFVAKPWDDDDLVRTLDVAFTRSAELQALAGMPAAAGSTPQEREARRLEEEEPGITKVNWRPDGAIDIEL